MLPSERGCVPLWGLPSSLEVCAGTVVLLAEQGEQHGLLLEETIAFLFLNNPSTPMCAVRALRMWANQWNMVDQIGATSFKKTGSPLPAATSRLIAPQEQRLVDPSPLCTGMLTSSFLCRSPQLPVSTAALLYPEGTALLWLP